MYDHLLRKGHSLLLLEGQSVVHEYVDEDGFVIIGPSRKEHRRSSIGLDSVQDLDLLLIEAEQSADRPSKSAEVLCPREVSDVSAMHQVASLHWYFDLLLNSA